MASALGIRIHGRYPVRRIAVLGSTGSIGVQALEVIRDSADLELHSILCSSSVGMITEQARDFDPGRVCVVNPPAGSECRGFITGPDSLEAAIDGADMVLNAIVGSQGLRASLLAAADDIPLALANKESLVVGGELLQDHISAGMVIPVDSEHSTVFRCLRGEDLTPGEILLTASGGSLRDVPLSELDSADPATVLAHPTWDMGARITVDSATMVNKAFEVIEAGWLFPGIPVDVVIHPQSVVHSLVRLTDGAWKALLGTPDMKIPVQYALAWPAGTLERISGDSPLDWGELSFEPVERRRYPAFGTVLDAGESGGTSPAVANASDEVAVGAFLEGRISFGGIGRIIERVLSRHTPAGISCLDDVLEADRWARDVASGEVANEC
jgi:1-deoxy-D-xylulose-5-phosphate reductoisomerase